MDAHLAEGSPVPLSTAIEAAELRVTDTHKLFSLAGLFQGWKLLVRGALQFVPSLLLSPGFNAAAFQEADARESKSCVEVVFLDLWRRPPDTVYISALSGRPDEYNERQLHR